MAINGAGFHEQKARQFRAANSPRFDGDYVRALNIVLNELKAELQLTSAPSTVSNIGSNIDFDAGREYAISAGIDYWLVRFGHQSGDLSLNSAFAAYDSAKRLARLDRDQDAEDAATDGEVFASLAES